MIFVNSTREFISSSAECAIWIDGHGNSNGCTAIVFFFPCLVRSLFQGVQIGRDAIFKYKKWGENFWSTGYPCKEWRAQIWALRTRGNKTEYTRIQRVRLRRSENLNSKVDDDRSGGQSGKHLVSVHFVRELETVSIELWYLTCPGFVLFFFFFLCRKTVVCCFVSVLFPSVSFLVIRFTERSYSQTWINHSSKVPFFFSFHFTILLNWLRFFLCPSFLKKSNNCHFSKCLRRLDLYEYFYWRSSLLVGFLSCVRLEVIVGEYLHVE